MTDTANANDIIMKGLSNETEGLGRFGHHPNPAIDFCIEVETLESRLHQAEHGLSKPRSVPETIAAVLHDIQKALNFRVGGDEGAVSAKHLLRSLEDKAKSLILTDTANAPEPSKMRKMIYENRSHLAPQCVWLAYSEAAEGGDLCLEDEFLSEEDFAHLKHKPPEYVLATHCDELVAAARAEGAREAQAKIARLTEALKWYGEQAQLCRLIHSEGDAGRNALNNDGGKRAAAALQENANE